MEKGRHGAPISKLKLGDFENCFRKLIYEWNLSFLFRSVGVAAPGDEAKLFSSPLLMHSAQHLSADVLTVVGNELNSIELVYSLDQPLQRHVRPVYLI